MVDFVLKQKEKRNCLLSHNSFEFYKSVTNYANFLKQPLELWMFVPCDENGNYYEKPCLDNYSIDEEGSRLFNNALSKWKIAYDKCIFSEDLNEEELSILMQYETVENLVEYNLQLSQNCIKKIEWI